MLKKGWIFVCVILISISCSRPKEYLYKFAICAMFKDEAPYLKEWIEYHKYLGAEHFYLYNNDSTDDFLQVLEPYIEKGIVELIDWKSTKKHGIWKIEDVVFIPYQLGAYNECIKKRALGKAKWVAVIDIDEYIVPVEGKESFLTLLDQEAESKTGSLLLPWRVFGTSSVYDIQPHELLTEKLIQRTEDDHSWNRLFKSIHRPEAIDFCIVHIAKKLKRKYTTKTLQGDQFRIQHYWSGPRKRLFEKRGFTSETVGKFEEEFNRIEDRSILPLLEEMKSQV